MVPIAFVNNLLKYGLNEIALCFRSRLTKHYYQQYLTGFTYYKMSNLDSRIGNPDQVFFFFFPHMYTYICIYIHMYKMSNFDSRIGNADQQLTQDIDKL